MPHDHNDRRNAGEHLSGVRQFFEWAIGPILEALAKVDRRIKTLTERIDIMATGMERLTAEVTEMDSAVDGVVTVLNNLAQQIRDSAGNEAKTNELADKLDASAKKLADAIAANTPADPEAPPAEPTS